MGVFGSVSQLDAVPDGTPFCFLFAPGTDECENSSFAPLGLGHFPLTPTAYAVGCILYAEHVRQLRVKVPSQPDGGEG
jgi:hypothetical protein